jgi:hypothetical protein
MPQKKLWRCTINACYQADCPGKTDRRARQGHYIEAYSETGALRQMRFKFPAEAALGFTADLWHEIASHVN